MPENQPHDARILIVDDEPANVRLLERILQREGFRNIDATNDPRHFLALYASQEPDIVLLDLHMPGLDGFAVLEQLKGRIDPGNFVPIVVLTADVTPEARQRALRSGAKDFLTKPVDPTEVVLRIKNLLETRHYYRELQGQNRTLERRVSDRTRQLERAQIEILERLARAAEYRDDETGHHAQRVGHMSAHGRGGGIAPPRGPPPRRGKNRHSGPHPPQAWTADGGRIRGDEEAHGHRRGHAVG
jgi:putative two-component system response regulator